MLEILEVRAHYLDLLSLTTKPGLLLHIVAAIDHADAELDLLDPEHRMPRDELVAVPKA